MSKNDTPSFLQTLAVAALVAVMLGGSIAAEAQQTIPYQNPNYPPMQPVPAQPYPQQPMQYAPQQQQRKPSFLRELFAGTIGAILQGMGDAATGGLVSGLTGTIVNWFSRKQNDNIQYGQNPYAQNQYGQNPAYAPNAAYPNYPAADAYPNNAYPGAATATGYPNAAAYSYEPQLYDLRTGQPAQASAQEYYSRGAADSSNALYAGVAYEVHALAADGAATPVNPATYAFRTGDRFVVYYRPSMPGRMDVYNINPLGQQTRIDSANMAAGQLTTLGPYEFTTTKGEDSLRLVLMPCSTNDLLVATRDIVNVSAGAPTAATPGGFSLSNCGAPATRSVTTRDITKVAVDGTTNFALDPISAQEYSSGQVDAREVTIVFHHQ